MSATIHRIGPQPCLVIVARMPIGDGKERKIRFAIGPFENANDALAWHEAIWDIATSSGYTLVDFALSRLEVFNPRALPEDEKINELVNPNSQFGRPSVFHGHLQLILESRGTVYLVPMLQQS